MTKLNYDELFKKYDCQYLPSEIVEKMIKDRMVRTAICKSNFTIFFHFYFAHYVKCKTAPFQHEMLRLAEDETVKNLFVVAFRGSSKSTTLTTAYPIWSILGAQKKHFVLILCQTRHQAKQHMMNLRRELEGNTLLRNDLGPFEDESDEWGSSSLVFPKLNARITAISTEQSIRGLRHNQYRPDLIIADDVEDLASTKTRESREKTYNWLTGEVIPSGDQDTRLIVVGNLLHEDSLLMRLKQDVEEAKIDGTFKAYPLLDPKGNIAWPGKYPNMAAIEAEKKKTGSDPAWQREYLLRIVSDAGRVVHPEWLHYYDYDKELPRDGQLQTIYVGVDLAISEKDSAHRTAMVAMKIYNDGEKRKAYVMPHPFNDTIGFPEQANQIKLLASQFQGRHPSIFVEKVAYQDALIQYCRTLGIEVKGVPPHGDKRERLALTTAAIKEGLILFPKKGAEELILQLIGLGTEKYDDLADAFSLVANQFIAFCNQPTPGIFFIDLARPLRRGLSDLDDDDDDYDFVVDRRSWGL
jgi:predicted phage terminase large subunit-like protein